MPPADVRSRGRLTVFVGAASGVGKTYALLETVRRALDEGRDAVVGLVETRGRYDTAALLLGLPLVPRRVVTTEGVRVETFDVDAVLARRPALCAVDDPGRPNPPGARHARRFQELDDLLDAGIDVVTALDVTALESLRDVAERITRETPGDTVPDTFLAQASEVRFVDRPGELGGADEGTRAALRELALRYVAGHADAAVTRFRAAHDVATTWPVRERVVVGVSPSPASASLLRGASRLAQGLRAQLVAVHVGASRGLSETARARLEANLALAEALGAEVVTVRADDAAAALVRVARARNATRIVVGKPTHARLRDRLRPSFLDDVVRASDEIEVHVMAGAQDGPPPEPPPRPPFSVLDVVVPAAAVGSISLLGLAIGRARALPDVALVFVAATLLVALRRGRRAAVTTAVLSVAAYDFFFVPPVLTLAAGNLHHVLTFGVLLVVGVVTAELTARLRAEAAASRRAEARARVREILARALARSARIEDVAAALGEALAPARIRLWDARAEGDGHGTLEGSARLVEAARWVTAHGRRAGTGGTFPDLGCTVVPLAASGPVEGVVATRRDPAPGVEDLALAREREELVTLAAQTLERLRLEHEAEHARLAAETELMRSNVLSSVSHDLRTPLAVVTGAATALETEGLSPEGRSTLVASIVSEAARLERLVKNLLDMTRIEAGTIAARLEPVPVEELVGSALGREAARLEAAGLAVTTEVDGALVAYADPVLFEQVLVNLFDNVRRHASGAHRLVVRAFALGSDDGHGDLEAPRRIALHVEDDGPGFPPGTETRAFERFFRAEAGKGGTGLGLAICKGLVEAQGGRIRAERRAEGARIVVELGRADDLGAAPEADGPDDAREAAS